MGLREDSLAGPGALKARPTLCRVLTMRGDLDALRVQGSRRLGLWDIHVGV